MVKALKLLHIKGFRVRQQLAMTKNTRLVVNPQLTISLISLHPVKYRVITVRLILKPLHSAGITQDV